MSHWFHRNKLKGTIDQKFDGKGTALKSTGTKMLQDLRSARQNLLTLFTDEVAKPEMIQVTVSLSFKRSKKHFSRQTDCT